MDAGKHYYPEPVRDNDPIPYYPHVVFSSNIYVPELPGLIRGRGSWQGVEEPSYALPAEEAWRIWPFTGDQKALLYLKQRQMGTSRRQARLLERDMAAHSVLGYWDVVSDITSNHSDCSTFDGWLYQIKPVWS
jgi:hypothetical protein